MRAVTLVFAALGACRPHWTSIPVDAEGNPGFQPKAVHAGAEVIFWGGHSDFGATRHENGIAWNLESRSWRHTMWSDGGPRVSGAAVWTGTEMLAWGFDYQETVFSPYDEDVPGPLGNAYDPELNAWRDISAVGAPDSASRFAIAWTGAEMLVWGGMQGDTCLAQFPGAYDPATDTWRPLASEGAPSLRESAAVVWTGTEMLVWGGAVSPEDPVDCPSTIASGHHRSVGIATSDGAAYDPATDSWRPISREDSPPPQYEARAFWTGTHMLVVGGVDEDRDLQPGGLYDPVTDTWQAVDTFDATAASWWRDGRLFSWGVQDGIFGTVPPNPSRLASFDPLTGAVELSPAPAYETDFTAVWTGSELVAWRGQAFDGNVCCEPADDGWLYEP